MGIIAINLAKLLKQNFLKDNAKKIISVFRQFRIRKRRIMSRFVDILFKKFLKMTVIPTFKTVSEYDGLKIASNCIKRNLEKYVE